MRWRLGAHRQTLRLDRLLAYWRAPSTTHVAMYCGLTRGVETNVTIIYRAKSRCHLEPCVERGNQ
jgi:hypothetical protein